MTRGARIAGWVGIGILAGVVLALIAVLLITRTEWGMERARGVALGWLEDRVEGELRIGRISGGGLLSGATVHDLAIDDPFGRPFVRADSARLAYNWRTLLAGEIVLEDVVLYDPEIYIEKMPGDTAWNYEYIFPDTTPGQSTPGRDLILFQDARIIGGLAVVRLPFDPDETIEPDDTANVTWERVPAGLVRVMRFDAINARLDRVIWESPAEPGKLVEIEQLSTAGVVYREPLELQALRGRLTVRDSAVAFEVPHFELPASRGSMVGRVITGGERLVLDIQVDAEQMRFRDLQWLYTDFPEEGGGEGRVRIQTQQPKGTLLLAENANLFAPGTRVAGTLGMVFGDTMYFTQVDLRASPLNIQFLEDLLPGTLPIDGLLVGTVEVQGPLSALEIDGDVRLQGGSSAGSSVRVQGTFDATRDFAARDVEADVRDFDLGIVERLRPGTGLKGRVDGRVEARGSPAGTYEFAADLTHRLPAQPVSRFAGSGSLARGGAFDITLNALPVSLAELAAYYPALEGLHGDAAGTVRARGTTADMQLSADLTTAGGPILVEAELQRVDGTSRYTGYATSERLAVGELFQGAPAATFSARVDFDLAGATTGQLTGPVSLNLDSVSFAGHVLRGDMLAPLLRMSGRLDDGVLRVDTARTRTEALAIDATGSFGILEGRTGTLDVTVTSTSLTPLEAHLFDQLSEPGAEPRVAGTLDATGRLTGGLSAFDLAVDGGVHDLMFERHRIDSGSVVARASGIGSDNPEWNVRLTADSLLLLDARLDSLRATIGYADGTTRIAADARGREDALTLGVHLLRTGDTLTTVVDSLVAGVGRGTWRLAESVRGTLEDGSLLLQPFRLARADGAGFIEGGGRLAWGMRAGQPLPVDFSLGLDGLPLDNLLELAGLGSLQDGVMQGNARLTGTTAAPYVRGGFAIDSLQLNDARLARVDGIVTYTDELVEIDLSAMHEQRRALTASGRLPIDLRLLPLARRSVDTPVDFRAQADSFPLAIALGVVDGFEQVRGHVNGELSAIGVAGATQLGGGLNIIDGAATWAPVGVRYHDIEATFEVMQDRVFFVDATARAAEPRQRPGLTRTGGGSARVTGRIDFAEPSDPRFDVRMLADNLLAANRRDVALSASGDAYLRGSYRAPVVTATLNVDGGALYIDELYRQYLVVGLDSPLLFDAVDTTLVAVRRVLPASENPFLRNLIVRDTRVTVGPGSWLRSREVNVEVTGDLNVALDRRRGDITLTGTLEAQRGTYDLSYAAFTRRFDVREGTVEFAGTPGIDPTLAITAVYRARSGLDRGEAIEILAQLTGSLQAPRVELTSNEQPPISESDLASYLFFGVPTYALNITGGGTAGGLTDLGLSALGPTVLGSFASGLQSLAQRFGLVDYVGLTAAENASLASQQSSRYNVFSGLFSGTNLEVGRYWGPVYVAATQRLDGGFEPGFRLEWNLNPTFTAELFGEDRFAREPGFGALQSTDFRKVYGFSLFREWTY